MKQTLQRFNRMAIMAAAGFLMTAGCRQTEISADANGNGNNGPASVRVYVTDHQSLIYDSVLLNIVKFEVKVEDNGIDSLGGWRTLAITPGVFDILRFRNGLDTLFATGTLPPGRKLQKIRMTLGSQNSVVYQGVRYPLIVKDNRGEVEANLDDSNVDSIAPGQYAFWIDFDAHHSIQQKSNNRYELKSKIKIFSKSRSGRIEGRVLPAAAQAMVLAIRGADTATAIPESDGKFKIVALQAGTYKLWFDATANNYQDSIINNVVVTHHDDTKINTVVLHQ